MKTFILFAVFIFNLTILAQSPKIVEDAPKNFEKALKASNDGMVESAIFHTLKFKLFYPEQDIERLKEEIRRLVKEGKTEAIRYKAFLAYEFLENPELIFRIEKADYKDGDEFFRLLARELQERLLVTK